MEICISWVPFGAKKIFSLGAWETFWESTLLFSHGSTNIVLTHGMIEYASPSSLQVTRPSRPSPSPASWPPPRPKPTLWRKLRPRHLRCLSGLASLLVKLSYLVERFRYFRSFILHTIRTNCQAPTQLPTRSPLHPNSISTSSQFNSSKSWVGVMPYIWFSPPPTHPPVFFFNTINPM